eukprot:24952-Prorocentrum_minimum.AAC.1
MFTPARGFMTGSRCTPGPALERRLPHPVLLAHYFTRYGQERAVHPGLLKGCFLFCNTVG